MAAAARDRCRCSVLRGPHRCASFPRAGPCLFFPAPGIYFILMILSKVSDFIGEFFSNVNIWLSFLLLRKVLFAEEKTYINKIK